MRQQMFAGGRRLDDRAVRRQVPLEHANAGCGPERVVERPDDVVVEDFRVFPVSADRHAEHRRRIRMQQVLDAVHHGRQPAGIGEILAQIFA
ncbi:hypothetical protein D3C72_2272940 [compost metagenome]